MKRVNRPLSGIRILDLTTVVVGPACTIRLADYGADVIKLEPVDGDLLRVLGGPSPQGGHSGPYLQFNRAKRSLAMDLKRGEARTALDRLIDTSDVVVANMRPDALARLGLDAKTTRAERPRLIHCLISGFGPGGPYTGRPAYDSVLQGAAGVGGLFATRGGEPQYVPFLMCDHVAGEIAAGAILASLFERERSGVGAEIEVPMYETMSAFVLQEHLAAQSFVPGLAGPGDRRVLSASNRPVKTADGWLSLTTNTDKQSRALLSAIGRDDLADDPRFSTVAARIRNIDEWLQLRNDAIKSRTTEEWLQILHELDIPCMPCHSLESMLGDPHLSAVGLLQQTEHSVEGTVVQVRPTILTNGSHADPGSPAVPVGWNTREILEEIGLHHDEVNELIASGAALDGRRDGN